MKSFWTKSAMGAAAALLCVGAANAYVIDFENSNLNMNVDGNSGFAPQMLGGDVFLQDNYFIQALDAGGGGGLIAGVSNATDSSLGCLDSGCPTGSQGNFLSVVDDGLLHIGNVNGTKISFSSASFAFIKASGDSAGSIAMYLAVEADRSDGSYAAYAFPISGSGAFQTVTLASAGQALTGSTGTLTSGDITDLFLYSYYCNPTTGGCTAFHTNKSQFAIDNIAVDVSAVPEPSEWMLMAAGLGVMGAIVRRRRTA